MLRDSTKPFGAGRTAPVILGLAVVAWLSYRHLACESELQASQRSVTGNLQVYLRHVEESVAWEPDHVQARIQAGRVAVSGMITHRLGLAETGLGFLLVAEARDSIKVIIEPQR